MVSRGGRGAAHRLYRKEKKKEGTGSGSRRRNATAQLSRSLPERKGIGFTNYRKKATDPGATRRRRREKKGDDQASFANSTAAQAGIVVILGERATSLRRGKAL